MGGDAFTRVGEVSNRGKVGLRHCQSRGEVGGRGEVQNKPVAPSTKLLRGIKHLAVKGHEWGGGDPRRVRLHRYAPVDQLCLWKK